MNEWVKFNLTDLGIYLGKESSNEVMELLGWFLASEKKSTMRYR